MHNCINPNLISNRISIIRDKNMGELVSFFKLLNSIFGV